LVGRLTKAAVRPSRHLGRTVGSFPGRAHLHPLEAAVGEASSRCAGVRGLLQGERVVAGGCTGAATTGVGVNRFTREALTGTSGTKPQSSRCLCTRTR